MGFAGELATIGLPEVFRNVAFNRLTGVLTIAERDRKSALFFDDGMIRAFSSGAGHNLDYEAIAERADAAPTNAIDAARRRGRRESLRSVLAAAGVLDETRYDAGVRTVVEEEVILLFGRREASFVFDENPPKSGVFDIEQLECRLEIDPETLAMEAVRRNDEWHDIARHIGSETEIFLAGDVEPPPDTTPEAVTLLRLLDGTRDLRSAIDALPFGRFHALRLVAHLVDQGLVTRASADQLRELASGARERGEINRAAHYLVSALDREGNDLDVRRELIALHESSGRKNDAAREYKRLAAMQEERGDIAGALDSYEHAAELLPHETDTLARVAAIHEARGDVKAYCDVGRRLGKALRSQRRYEQALIVYQDLLARDDEDSSLREAIATTYIKLYEPQKAAEELVALAAEALAAGKWERALHFYRSVLAVDRDNPEAKERIEEIESGHTARLRIRRRRRMLYAVFAIIVGFGTWQLVREIFAREALHNAGRAAVSGLVRNGAEGHAVESLRLYARICEDFRWTRGASRAEEMVQTLLIAEINRVRGVAPRDPDAAEAVLRQIGHVPLPTEHKRLWRAGRDDILRRIQQTRANGVPALGPPRRSRSR